MSCSPSPSSPVMSSSSSSSFSSSSFSDKNESKTEDIICKKAIPVKLDSDKKVNDSTYYQVEKMVLNKQKYKRIRSFCETILTQLPYIGIFGGAVRDFILHDKNTEEVLKNDNDNFLRWNLYDASVVPSDIDIICSDKEHYDVAKHYLESKKFVGKVKKNYMKNAECTQYILTMFNECIMKIDLVFSELCPNIDFDVNSLVMANGSITTMKNFFSVSRRLTNTTVTNEVSSIISNIIKKRAEICIFNNISPKELENLFNYRVLKLISKGFTINDFIDIKGMAWSIVDNKPSNPYSKCSICDDLAIVKNEKMGLRCAGSCWDIFYQQPEIEKHECFCGDDKEVEFPLSCGHWVHRSCQYKFGTKCAYCKKDVYFGQFEQTIVHRYQHEKNINTINHQVQQDQELARRLTNNNSSRLDMRRYSDSYLSESENENDN